MSESGRTLTSDGFASWNASRRYPDRPPFDAVPWSLLSKDERALVTEWHMTTPAREQS